MGSNSAPETVKSPENPLVEHLKPSGHVVMHKPPLGPHGAPGNLNLSFAWGILRHQLEEL
jgi:hypothetical protein